MYSCKKEAYCSEIQTIKHKSNLWSSCKLCISIVNVSVSVILYFLISYYSVLSYLHDFCMNQLVETFNLSQRASQSVQNPTPSILRRFRSGKTEMQYILYKIDWKITIWKIKMTHIRNMDPRAHRATSGVAQQTRVTWPPRHQISLTPLYMTQDLFHTASSVQSCRDTTSPPTSVTYIHDHKFTRPAYISTL